MKDMILALIDCVVTSVFVAGTVWLLSFLDKHPMPFLASIGLEDIRFWCPPHAAIAIWAFTFKKPVELYMTMGGMLMSVVATIAVIEIAEPMVKGDDHLMVLRAIAVGTACLAQKLSGAVFPPAGAVAVLFVDNAALKGALGRFYILTPGLTGTAVIVVLATIKMKALGFGHKHSPLEVARMGKDKTQ